MKKNEKKVFFPMHIGSGNRGCAGISEGIIKTLNLKKENTYLLEMNEEELIQDSKFGLSNIAILKKRVPLENNLVLYSTYRILNKLKFPLLWFKTYPYHKFLNLIKEEDVVFFTGGDLFCYPDMAKINCYIQNKMAKKNVTTFLWGASIEEKLITKNMIRTFKSFDGIIVRESISKKTLEKIGINNVSCYPDPAFSLDPVVIELPQKLLKKKLIGINLSDFVGQNIKLDSIFGKNIINLFNYILKYTNYTIVLIPHVLWEDQDDRNVCKMIEEYFKNDRIVYMNTENYNYLQIRYFISKCDLFIGARTHSVISAYSTCVPAIALGYSVKSHGIAKDLGLDKKLVVDYRNLVTEYELLDSFKYLVKNKVEIADNLNKIMPEYRKKSFLAKEYYESVVGNTYDERYIG